MLVRVQTARYSIEGCYNAHLFISISIYSCLGAAGYPSTH